MYCISCTILLLAAQQTLQASELSVDYISGIILLLATPKALQATGLPIYGISGAILLLAAPQALQSTEHLADDTGLGVLAGLTAQA